MNFFLTSISFFQTNISNIKGYIIIIYHIIIHKYTFKKANYGFINLMEMNWLIYKKIIKLFIIQKNSLVRRLLSIWNLCDVMK